MEYRNFKSKEEFQEYLRQEYPLRRSKIEAQPITTILVRTKMMFEELDIIFKEDGKTRCFFYQIKKIKQFFRNNAEYAEDIKEFCKRNGCSFNHYKN